MAPRSAIACSGVLGALVLAAGVAHVEAARAKPPPCPDGRFRVVEGGLLVGRATPTAIDFVELRAGQVGLGTTCPLARGKAKGGKRGTTVRGRWKQCGALQKVQLKATIAHPDCALLAGRIKAKKHKAASLRAVRSTCGDGVLDPASGEACEGTAGCAAGTRCEPATCRCEDQPATTTTTPVASTSTSTIPAEPAVCGDGAVQPGEPCDPLAAPSGCAPGEQCDLAAGGCACGPVPATIGRTVAHTPGPPVDVAALGVPVVGDGHLVMEVPGAALAVHPDLADPITAVGRCVHWIVSCLAPPERTLDDCARSAPACATDEPWLEAARCCPAACFVAYEGARRTGTAPVLALHRVYFESAACFPGVATLLGRP